MQNPYDDYFEENPKSEELSKQEKHAQEEVTPPSPTPETEESLPEPEKESLDLILERIALFNQEAQGFSLLLTEVNAEEHKVESSLTQFFLVAKEDKNKRSLAEEKIYHQQLMTDFINIIEPMRTLSELHLDTIKQFKEDIDENYYSVEQSDSKVKMNKTRALEGITLQRKVLADAASSLSTLEEAMHAGEQRINDHVNSGKEENLSQAEFELLIQKRTQLTRGFTHQFDYSFFKANLLDKTAISLGIFMKETSNQYLTKLLQVFEYH